MKKILFIPLIAISIGCSLFYAMELNKPTIALSSMSLSSLEQQHALAQIIILTNLHHKIAQLMLENTASPDESIIKVTQQEWLRKPGTERWDMDGLHEDKAAQLMPLFKDLGMCTVKEPTQKEYTYGIMLGALASSVTERLKFLDKVCSQGVILKQVVLLGGVRVLTPEELAFLKETFHCEKTLTTETDMMVYILQDTDIAPHVKKLPLCIVNTPEPAPGKRPTTNDTVAHWFKTYNPTPGSCLAVSTNPFIPYQHIVLRTLLPDLFTIETIGSVDSRLESGNKRVALLLDSLARWLYQEHERQKKLKSV